VRLSGGEGLLQVVDLKPIPLAHGHRIHGLDLPEAAVGLWGGPFGRLRRVRADAGDERAGSLLSLCPPSRERPGELGEGVCGRPTCGAGGPGLPVGPRGQDASLPA
jgi:hypothetical protein